MVPFSFSCRTPRAGQGEGAGLENHSLHVAGEACVGVLHKWRKPFFIHCLLAIPYPFPWGAAFWPPGDSLCDGETGNPDG